MPTRKMGCGDLRITRALVTGGVGFVGSHIVEALNRRGVAVTVLDNLDQRVHGEKTHSLPSGVGLVEGDLLSQRVLGEALRIEPDVVFHEAALVGLGKGAVDAESYVSTNAIGTIRLMDAIARHVSKPPRFILASTMAIYGEGAYYCPGCEQPKEGTRRPEDLANQDWEPRCSDCGQILEARPVTEDQPPRPRSIYAISKLSQELLCMALGREYDLPVVSLRYHNIYGPRMPRNTPYAGVASIFKSRLLEGAPLTIYEDGKQLRDFIHVDDIVQANLLAAEAPEDKVAFEAFNVGTGRPHQISDFALEMIKSLNSHVKPEYPGLFRLGDVRHVFASIAKIRRLGFTPQVTFEDGVSRFALEPIRAASKAAFS
jgi:dTDP-L-rhamnose 4-epimerase